MTDLSSSTPSFTQFDPRIIPYQFQVIQDVFYNFDYSLGTHEILLNGSVGSAKSILMAHIAVRHCVQFRGARFMLGRKAMPDLKSTIYTKVKEHMFGDFIEDVDYVATDHIGRIVFRNRSEIISRSWADKKYKKLRSLELSGAAIEELTENDEDDKQAYIETKMRVGRLAHVPQKILIAATNPDSPAHWAYDYFKIGERQALRGAA